jgi:hypothetical protein
VRRTRRPGKRAGCTETGRNSRIPRLRVGHSDERSTPPTQASRLRVAASKLQT